MQTTNAINLFSTLLISCIITCRGANISDRLDVTGCDMILQCENCTYKWVEPKPTPETVESKEECIDFCEKNFSSLQCLSIQWRAEDEVSPARCNYINRKQYIYWKTIDFATEYEKGSEVWRRSCKASVNTKKPECTPKKSIGQCERCLSSDQCKEGFCCPFMKLCVPTSTTPCPAAHSAGCQPPCYDDMDPNSCTCRNKDFPGKWPKPTCV